MGFRELCEEQSKFAKLEEKPISSMESPLFSLLCLNKDSELIFEYKDKIKGDVKYLKKYIHYNGNVYIPDINGRTITLNRNEEINRYKNRIIDKEFEAAQKGKNASPDTFEGLKAKVDNLIYQKDADWDQIKELIIAYILKNERIYSTRDDERSEMWIYKNGIYIPEGKTYVREFCRKILREKLTSHKCNDILFKIEIETYVDQDKLFKNPDKDLIAVKNGILNIRTKELFDFHPKYRFFNKLDIDFDPNAENDVFDEFFREIIVEKDLKVMQELFGYCLYRDYPVHKAVMFNGKGRNGKGTTLNLIEKFVGVKNVIDLTLKDMEQDNFTLQRLHNKMVNISGDIDSSYVENSGTFKKLTGGDTVTAKRKFKTEINFKNYAKMIFACNELPKFKDDSEGFKERWILIDFPFKFVEPEKYAVIDPKEKIEQGYKEMNINKCSDLTSPENMTALLNWALKGLERLLKQKAFSPGNFDNVFDIWEQKNNTVISFIKTRCNRDFGQEISVSEFKQEYGKFCQKQRVKTESTKVIESTLEKRYGIFKIRKSEGNFYEGINLNKYVM